MEHASENNPKKELLFALVGTVLFLGIVLLIAISAFLRPAGHHVTPTPTTDNADAATIDAEVVDTDAAEVPLTATAQEAQETTEVEADANPQEAVAEATDTDSLAATPSTGNLRFDDVVVADDMSIGGEGAVESDAATSEATDSSATDSPADENSETESATPETNDSPEETEATAQ